MSKSTPQSTNPFMTSDRIKRKRCLEMLTGGTFSDDVYLEIQYCVFEGEVALLMNSHMDVKNMWKNDPELLGRFCHSYVIGYLRDYNIKKCFGCNVYKKNLKKLDENSNSDESYYCGDQCITKKE
jgi:hypothetical protein